MCKVCGLELMSLQKIRIAFLPFQFMKSEMTINESRSTKASNSLSLDYRAICVRYEITVQKPTQSVQLYKPVQTL